MADRLESPDPGVPPPAEVIHMPEPSYLPVVLAFGVMVALVGLIVTFVISVLGLVIALWAVFLWIRKARDEMADWPLEHH